MLVTPLPIVRAVRLLQKEKAFFLMLVTLSGIVMLVRLLQARKPESPILVTGFPPIVEGMISSTDVFPS